METFFLPVSVNLSTLPAFRLYMFETYIVCTFWDIVELEVEDLIMV